MKKGKLWKTVALLGVCLLVGVKYGIKYGWLASHTHWATERIRERPYLWRPDLWAVGCRVGYKKRHGFPPFSMPPLSYPYAPMDTLGVFVSGYLYSKIQSRSLIFSPTHPSNPTILNITMNKTNTKRASAKSHWFIVLTYAYRAISFSNCFRNHPISAIIPQLVWSIGPHTLSGLSHPSSRA